MTHPELRRIDIDAEAARLAEERKAATAAGGYDIAALAARLGWQGDSFIFSVVRCTEGAANLVRDYAAKLGIEGLHASDDLTTWHVPTGTPEKWLAADKMLAFVEGLCAATGGLS